ncbi:MAG: penicillin-binding transpeptidase domain-containing protein [Thermincola sp.]|nr:penicillin-binding transpeptidase domain-containing protein [Thermincola sp.]MDT3703993.1 penicillin-binding transpeptidase domain-containing protein [Thermincola sp.]
MNRNMVKIAGLVFAAFLVIIGYQTYLQVFHAGYLLNHPRNRRLQLLEEAVERGRILDRNSQILAETVSGPKGRFRQYPYGPVTSGITGYISGRYGRWGLEAAYNPILLGFDRDLAEDDFWAVQRVGKNKKGNDIILSIDVNLQREAYRLLGDRRGAVVALEPSTGRILAMVSKPGFDPAKVDTGWESLINDPASPLLNRAAQGLYPPGSAFKVITVAGALNQNPDTAQRIFDAPGYITIEGRRIEDRQAIGRLNFAQALARSSNYVFATLGLEQGAENLLTTARNFGLGRPLPFDLAAEEGNLPQPAGMSKLELGESAIGQGRILVTPLSMAMVAAAIANEGVMMGPTLVDEVREPGGVRIKSTQPKQLRIAASPDIAKTLAAAMILTVNEGTGTAAALPGVRVAGKTGSAQNPHGQTHAWFIGFAPAENPLVAVGVIVENAGAGGREAAPIAGDIIKKVIGQKR